MAVRICTRQEREALRSLIADVSGLETLWEDQPRPYLDSLTRAWVLLSELSHATLGRDELTYRTLAAPNDSKVQAVSQGVRRFTLSIKLESYELSDDETAMVRSEDLRDLLRLPFASHRLNCHGFGFVRFQDTADRSYVVDQRRISVSVIDMVLSRIRSVKDRVLTETIETVGITACLGPNEIRDTVRLGVLYGARHNNQVTRSGVIG